MKKSMRKLLAVILASAITATCVATVFAEGPSYTEPLPGPSTEEQKPAEPQPDGVTQVVDTNENGEAKVESIEETDKTEVSLSGKVTVDGVKYTVTETTAKVFANAPKATKATLPATLKTIASRTFTGSKVERATLKGSPKVQKGAFKKAPLKKLAVNGAAEFENGAFKGTEPKWIGISNTNVTFKKGAFIGAKTKNTVIKVNKAMTKKQYKSFMKMLKAAGFHGKVKVG